MKKLLIGVAAFALASQIAGVNAQESFPAGVRYRNHYYFSGFFLRAAIACQKKHYADVGLRLLAGAELKQFTQAYPKTIEQWMQAGADDFNAGVMRGGIKTACAWVPKVRRKFVPGF